MRHPGHVTEGLRADFRNLLWLAVVTASTLCNATILPAVRFHKTALVERERETWQTPTRTTEFSDIPHVSARSRCEDTQAPQALATPDPLSPPFAGMKIKVSFIVGTDGRVRSPLILQSAGPEGDRNILRTVRTWRYRPATCNGIPTEAEGKIEFHHH